MRAYALLITATVLTAFAAGTLALNAARGLQPVDEAAANVALTRARFEAQTTPEQILDLGALVPRIRAGELLDPEATQPQSQRYDFAQLSALVHYAQACDEPPTVGEPLAKALAWHRFACGAAELPPAFFETPPFMHPGGQSFAALGADRFGVEGHERWLHVSEWRWGPNPPRELLASLDRAALGALANRDALVLDARHVLLAHGETLSSFTVYPRRAWDAFIADAALAPHVARERDACVVREGRACWARNDAPFFARLGRLTLSLLALSLGTAVVTGVLLFRRQSHQRFVLQTLTHELRTPVASLLVSVELLREQHDEAHVLRVVDDAHRLRRLAENSRAYLGSGRLQPVALPSAAEFVRDVVGDTAQVEVLQDGAVTVDPWWLATCVKNLVDNANRHGAAPVVVSVRKATRLHIEVRDAGTWGASQVKGLGLGLSIVKRAVRSMGGRVDVHHHPTRFAIEVPA